MRYYGLNKKYMYSISEWYCGYKGLYNTQAKMHAQV